MYYSPFKKNRKTALQKRKCPEISSSSSSASIYISICIYTYTQSQRYTHLCQKNITFFPQSNTHFRTSPGASLYNSILLCLFFFYSEKNLKCWHIKANFSTTVISAIFKPKKIKKIMKITKIKFKTKRCIFHFVAWNQSRPRCRGSIASVQCGRSRFVKWEVLSHWFLWLRHTQPQGISWQAITHTHTYAKVHRLQFKKHTHTCSFSWNDPVMMWSFYSI